MSRVKLLFLPILLVVSIAFLLHLYYDHFKEHEHIAISTNPWVGYTPFVYAQEKGWLDDTPFRFLWLVDLSDNSKLHNRKFTQGFTATQYELAHFKQKEQISPIFLINRSYGADAILSNYTIDELRGFDDEIDVFLEIGSLNNDFFNAFVSEHKLERLRFIKIDTSQKSISHIELDKKPKIIISYHPYIDRLVKKGFSEIASTKTIKDFFVIDACFMNNEIISSKKDDLIKLKKIFKDSIEVLERDPREYYETIKGYLEGQSYEEFLEALDQIEWIYDNPSPEILEYLKSIDIDTNEILL